MTTYRKLEVCEKAGCTERQLDYWRMQLELFGADKARVGSGTYIDYTDQDLMTAAIAAALSKAFKTQLLGLVPLVRVGFPVVATDSAAVHLMVDEQTIRRQVGL